MPNWVTNIFTAKGTKDDIRQLLEAVKNEDSAFSFQKILPMPEELDVPKTSDEHKAVVYFLSERLTKKPEELVNNKHVLDRVKKENGFEMLLGQPITTPMEWLERNYAFLADESHYSEAEMENFYQTGRTYISNEEKYGFTNWYDWCATNWGTKWDVEGATVSDVEETGDGMCQIGVQFNTAWAMPYGIFVRLSEMFPSVILSGRYADEDIGSNCGVWFGINGMVGVREVNTKEFALEVLGYDTDDYYNYVDDEPVTMPS